MNIKHILGRKKGLAKAQKQRGCGTYLENSQQCSWPRVRTRNRTQGQREGQLWESHRTEASLESSEFQAEEFDFTPKSDKEKLSASDFINSVAHHLLIVT